MHRPRLYTSGGHTWPPYARCEDDHFSLGMQIRTRLVWKSETKNEGATPGTELSTTVYSFALGRCAREIYDSSDTTHCRSTPQRPAVGAGDVRNYFRRVGAPGAPLFTSYAILRLRIHSPSSSRSCTSCALSGPFVLPVRQYKGGGFSPGLQIRTRLVWGRLAKIM